MIFDRISIIKKLLETGTIDRATVARVMFFCKNKDSITLNVLANYSKLTSSQILDFFEKHFGIPNIDLDNIAINPEIARLLPKQIALDHGMLPAFKIIDKTHLAVSNPMDQDGIREAQKYIGERIGIFLAPEDQVIKALEKCNPKKRLQERSE